MAPTAHWGPRTHKMAGPIWRWCLVAPGAHWGPRMTGKLSSSTSRSYSGSQGSVGSKRSSMAQTYLPFMHNSYSGSCGSLGTQNSWNNVIYISWYRVALGAQWGCRKKVNGWINIWFIYWLLWFTGDQGSLGMARYTWRWYILASRDN